MHHALVWSLALRAISVAVGIAMLLAVATSIANVGHASGPDESITRGKLLWSQNECGECHEHAMEPGQPTLLLAHLSDRFDEATLAAFLSAPPRPMPDPRLEPEDRLALARYLLATFP